MDGASAIVQKANHVLVVNGDHLQHLAALVHLVTKHFLCQGFAIVKHLEDSENLKALTLGFIISN